MKPRLLIVNDDGITSPFLPHFARAMAGFADVAVVVPSREQSWIGRAFSRHCEVVVNRNESLGFECYEVGGTPSDCVNIALSHLFSGARPDAVVSGINIGQNVAMPLLWSSGTFSAAVEGAAWGIAAYAFSMRLQKKHYERCRLRHDGVPEDLLGHLQAACSHAAGFVRSTLGTFFERAEVLNVNYPADFLETTPVKECVPARAQMSAMYKKNDRGGFEFSYSLGEVFKSDRLTDLEALDAGWACWAQIEI